MAKTNQLRVTIRAVFVRESFKVGVLVFLLYVATITGGYNLYVRHVAGEADNQLFYHRQWLPGITLNWGWQSGPVPKASQTIQECLTSHGNITTPVEDGTCTGYTPSYHGFPFTVADGGSYNAAAGEFNDVLSLGMITATLTALYFMLRGGKVAA